jgi:hypothetical protein
MTYAELVLKLQGWWESDETDFVAEIDFIIEIAEKQLYRAIDLNAGRKEGTAIALVAGTAVVAIPTEVVTIYNAWLVTAAGARTSLVQKDVSYIDDYTGDRTLQGNPRFYAWYDADNILLGPAPDDATDTVVLSHTYRPDQLSETETTTWLSLNAPDLLLKACLVQVAVFQKAEPETIAGYEKELGTAITGVLMEENFRNRRDAYRQGEIAVNA